MKIISWKNNYKRAFTLAEVLITLAIIGVIAAMVVPALQNDINEMQYQVALKKFYADISSAMKTIQAPGSDYTIPENLSTEGGNEESQIMRDNLCAVMNCSKKGTVWTIWGTNINNTGTGTYRNYKSSYQIYTDLSTSKYAAELLNGMFIGVSNNSELRKSIQLYVDINGAKKPNMMGMDVYEFELVKNNNNYYVPIPGGGPGTYTDITEPGGRTCQANHTSYNKNWPCTYYRLFKPEEMP